MDNIAEKNQTMHRALDEGEIRHVLSSMADEAIRDIEARVETNSAGILNPRRLLKAQQLLAKRRGAEFVDAIASEPLPVGGGVKVTTNVGEFHFRKVLICTGLYSAFSRAMPPTKALGRTVTHFEIPQDLRERFPLSIPLIFQAKGFDVYIVPPTLYPDNKYYIKVGGDPDDYELRSPQDVAEWFRSAGRSLASEFHQKALARIFPAFQFTSAWTKPCAVSQAATGRPYLGPGSISGTWGFAGCFGSAAKSSDEIGRHAALIIMQDNAN